MNVDKAISRACADVGIIPPAAPAYGKWVRTDTLSGKNGKSDGQIIVNEHHVTAMNFQTGETVTVGMATGERTANDRREIAKVIEHHKAKKREQAARAAKIAESIVAASETAGHPYLSGKGFPAEKALVVPADTVRRLAGDYLVEESGKRAVVMPARIDHRITSLQLIWEDGSKKFLAGGEIGGSSHRIAKGADTWLCEGFATGLSLRMALKALRRTDTVQCCFSASNLVKVAKTIKGRCFIVADHDKIPMNDPFEGIGPGEHFAKASGKPYLMPPEVGTDLNDVHMRDGIFAVQRLISTFLRGIRM
jgi:putative DNA primase/helicase